MSKISCCGFACLAPTTSSCGICRACRRLWKTYGRGDPPTTFPQPPWKAAPRRRSAPYHSHLENRGRFSTATHRNGDYDDSDFLGERDSDNNQYPPNVGTSALKPEVCTFAEIYSGIARPPYRKIKGALKKTVCFPNKQDADFAQHKHRWQVRKQIRRLGWVTSCVPWTLGIHIPIRSPRARWKRPTFVEYPSCTWSSATRPIRVRIKARRTIHLANRKTFLEVCTRTT